MGRAPALTRIRHELIRAELARSGGVRTRDLVNRLGVSRATVRRDLLSLIDAGEAVNARGGALLPPYRAHGSAALERESLADAASAAIAADEIKVVGLFGGPLIHALARRLADREELCVITNSLAAAHLLAEPPSGRRAGQPARARQHPQVTMLGGTLHPGGAMRGGLATKTLAALRLDASYFDCAGFDPRAGAAVDDLSEAELRRVAIEVSDRAVLLVERGQSGSPALGLFASPADLHAVLEAPRPAGDRRGPAFQSFG